MADVLDEILARKREELRTIPTFTASSVKPSTRDFAHFIATEKKEIAVIAEIKRATPFRGVLSPKAIDAPSLAQVYEDAGAAAISVLTDQTFFQGSLADLAAVSSKVALPVLRKDFIIDIRQIFEARYHGADAILLMVRCLSDEDLRLFLETTERLHMRALVEVHDENELERALQVNAKIIGINNRNLANGQTDLRLTLDLLRKTPAQKLEGKILVSESGIEKKEDVQSLKGLVDAVLVGTTLMKAKNPSEKLQELVDAGRE